MQSPAYDTGNANALDAIVVAPAEAGAARGIAVRDAAKPDTEINRMDELDMCGFRFFRTSGTGADWNTLLMSNPAASYRFNGLYFISICFY